MATRIPKNIRQVGTPERSPSIFIEDYVLTYLKSEYNSEAAILVGESSYEEAGIKVFIRGVVACPQLYWREEGMEMTPRTLSYIYREIEHLYNNQEIVGWYMPVPAGDEEKILISLGEFHGRNFPGADKVFFYLNSYRGEEAFYIRDGQVFKRQPGYFIFYEKNLPMRDYMLARREEKQLEADLHKEIMDKPRETVRYREYVNMELEKKNKESGLLAYGISVFALIAVFALTIGMVSGYREVNDLGNIVETLGDVLGIEIPANINQEDVEHLESQGVTGSSEEESDASQDSAENEASENTENQDTTSAMGESLIGGTQFEGTDSGETPDSEVAAILAQGYYVVQNGENLAAISRKLYGTDEKVSAICEKNGISDPNKIYPGQTLYLP